MIISLWGFMGAGKSTIGRQLGERLGWDILDTDAAIEEEQNKKISRIFSEEGEEHFRLLEKNLVEQLNSQKLKNMILITGGGLPIWTGNAELLNDMGTSIFIDVPFDLICQRLMQDELRPLWNRSELNQMSQRYEQRRPSYQKAHIHIKAGNLPANEVTELIIKKLSFFE